MGRLQETTVSDKGDHKSEQQGNLPESVDVNLTSSDFNNIYQKASRSNSADSSILPAAENLLKQLGLIENSNQRRLQEVPAQQVPSVRNAIKDINDGQHKIATDALKDPQIRKVEEKRDQVLETVVTHDRDGLIKTYEPDGTIVREHLGMKQTIFPEGHASGIKQINESNGTVMTSYKDGTDIIIDSKNAQVTVRKDGKDTVYKPNGDIVEKNYNDHTTKTFQTNGTRVTIQPDGVEIVEEANGNRTVSKPEPVQKKPGSHK